MSNSKIRVQSKSLYSIEVNDKGECIYFDLSEVGLPARLLETYEGLQAMIAKFEKNKDEIANREDSKINEYVTQNQKDIIYLTEQYYKDARACLDKFLGEDACYKIFDNINYYEMFDDLIEQLSPEFEKMGLNIPNMQKNLVKKYAPKNDNVLK